MSKRGMEKIPILAKELEREEERLEYLESKAMSLPSMQEDERVQTSPKNTSELVILAAADLRKRVEHKQKQLDGLRGIAGRMIMRSKFSRDGKDILFYRYAVKPDEEGREYMRWPEIADLMHYSLRHVERMHNRLIRQLFDK